MSQQSESFMPAARFKRDPHASARGSDMNSCLPAVDRQCVGSQKPNGGTLDAPAKAGRESAHSLMTVAGRRSCSMGDNGVHPVLTPASLHNGCEQIRPVRDSLAKVRPTWACRQTAHLSLLPAQPDGAKPHLLACGIHLAGLPAGEVLSLRRMAEASLSSSLAPTRHSNAARSSARASTSLTPSRAICC